MLPGTQDKNMLIFWAQMSLFLHRETCACVRLVLKREEVMSQRGSAVWGLSL